MKWALSAAMAAICFPSMALAADLSPPAAGYDWSGAYAGLNGAGAWGHARWQDPGNGNATFAQYDTSGVLLGAQLGYRWQINHIVLGVEGAADWASFDGRQQDPTLFGTDRFSTQQDFLGSVTANVGLAFDRWHVYALGGLALGDFSHRYQSTADLPPIVGTTTASYGSRLQAGWTVGGGAAFAVTDTFSAGLQYNYNDFGSYRQSASNGPSPTRFRETEQMVSLRLNYKF